MDFRDMLEDRLKMYKENVVNGRKPELVMFYAEYEDAPIEHILIYAEQIPAINAFFDYEAPYFAIVKELGDTKYVYHSQEA